MAHTTYCHAHPDQAMVVARDLHVSKLEKQLGLVTKVHKHHELDKMKEIASLKVEVY